MRAPIDGKTTKNDGWNRVMGQPASDSLGKPVFGNARGRQSVVASDGIRYLAMGHKNAGHVTSHILARLVPDVAVQSVVSTREVAPPMPALEGTNSERERFYGLLGRESR